MASDYCWYLEQRVIYCYVEQVVTVKDLQKGNQIISQWIDESGHPPVHLLFDLRHITEVSVNTLQVWRELKYLRNPRLGWLVTFGASGLTRTMLHLIMGSLTRLIGQRLSAVDTLDAALAFLKMVDDSLPDLRPGLPGEEIYGDL